MFRGAVDARPAFVHGQAAGAVTATASAAPDWTNVRHADRRSSCDALTLAVDSVLRSPSTSGAESGRQWRGDARHLLNRGTSASRSASGLLSRQHREDHVLTRLASLWLAVCGGPNAHLERHRQAPAGKPQLPASARCADPGGVSCSGHAEAGKTLKGLPPVCSRAVCPTRERGGASHHVCPVA